MGKPRPTPDAQEDPISNHAALSIPETPALSEVLDDEEEPTEKLHTTSRPAHPTPTTANSQARGVAPLERPHIQDDREEDSRARRAAPLEEDFRARRDAPLERARVEEEERGDPTSPLKGGVPTEAEPAEAEGHPDAVDDENNHSHASRSPADTDITQEMIVEEIWRQEATSGLSDTSATQPLRRIAPRPAKPTGPLTAVPQTEPPQIPATPPLPDQSLRPARWQEALALALLILVVAGSLLGLRFIAPAQGTTHPAAPTGDVSGPFVQSPLNAAQIDALRHLASRMQYKQLASLYVSRMTLDEEVGQLIMVEYSDTSYSNDLDTMVNQLHAGGVIMYEFQMLTADQTKHDIAHMQQRATLPLLISTDEEGGPWVHRLKNIYGLRPSALDIYNSGDVTMATQQGHKVAQDLLSLGINENLAPDVDVALVNGIDQVTRTFGFTPDSVIKYAGPYMKAMQSDGVIACIKHFPGLGAATVDAHAQLPVVNRTRQQIYDVELAPFKYFVQSPDQLEHPGMVMPTDVLMPAIDPVMPAELSHIFMTDILRKEFGYDGVVLTDALYMGGVEVNGAPLTMSQAAVMALNAGDDMILGPDGADQTLAVINAIKAALQNGTLSKARIDEAATRIIALKMQGHLMAAVPPQV